MVDFVPTPPKLGLCQNTYVVYVTEYLHSYNTYTDEDHLIYKSETLQRSVWKNDQTFTRKLMNLHISEIYMVIRNSRTNSP